MMNSKNIAGFIVVLDRSDYT